MPVNCASGLSRHWLWHERSLRSLPLLSGTSMANAIRNVFISYARQDALEFPKRLANDLREAGHQVFVDLTDIEKGGLWEVRLEEGIRGSDVLASVMTLGALRHPVVPVTKWSLLLNEGKSVIPLKLDPSPNLKPTLLLQLGAMDRFLNGLREWPSGPLLRHFTGDLSAFSTTALVLTVTGVVPLDFAHGQTGHSWRFCRSRVAKSSVSQKVNYQ